MNLGLNLIYLQKQWSLGRREKKMIEKTNFDKFSILSLYEIKKRCII